jgi:hypothetical protein
MQRASCVTRRPILYQTEPAASHSQHSPSLTSGRIKLGLQPPLLLSHPAKLIKRTGFATKGITNHVAKPNIQMILLLPNCSFRTQKRNQLVILQAILRITKNRAHKSCTVCQDGDMSGSAVRHCLVFLFCPLLARSTDAVYQHYSWGGGFV